MKMRTKVFSSEIKGINEKERTITAYVSTAARDRMDESLDPKGADLRSYKKNPVVLFGHDYSQPPIGKALWIKKDDKGLVSKVQFANTERANEIFDLYKEGFMRAFSVGFIPKKWDDGDGKKTASRTYTDWEMLEYSAVPVPANPEALTLAMQKGILSESLKKQFEDINIDDLEGEFDYKQESYKCECIECGEKVTSKKHCKDIKCPECGGEMRRAERPGPGKGGEFDNEEKAEGQEEEGNKEGAESKKEEGDTGTSEEASDTETGSEANDMAEDKEDVKDKGLGELLVELEHIKEHNIYLDKENAELRCKLFNALRSPDDKTVSEMTDDELVKTINECIVGVIREVTGKVS